VIAHELIDRVGDSTNMLYANLDPDCRNNKKQMVWANSVPDCFLALIHQAVNSNKCLFCQYEALQFYI
jgi:hypothetical protein